MKPRFLWLTIGSVLLVVAAGLLLSLVWEFFVSGECVSSGGSYDYLLGQCDFSHNHVSVPFYRNWLFWLATVASGAGAWSLERGSASHVA